MKNQSWHQIRLGDAVKINNKSIDRSFHYDEIEYFDTSSVYKNFFNEPEVLKREDAPSRARRLVQNGDVIISTVRPNQEHVGLIQKPKENTVVSTGFAVITPISIESKFLYYYLSQPSIVAYLSAIAETSTSTFPAIRPEILEDLQVTIPAYIEEQKRIGEFLFLFDQKIDLNLKTNQTLEEISQAIFKEWFIDFNYPGATGEMVDSPLGPIPKGWRVSSVGDIVELANETITPGKTPDILFSHYSIPAFDGARFPLKEFGSSILSNKFIVKCNSVLVSKLNPRFPRVWPIKDVEEDTSICSTEFQVLLPKKEYYHSFVYNLFNQPFMIDTMRSMVSGTSSSHQRVDPKAMLKIHILLPADPTIYNFEQKTKECLSLQENNLQESINLGEIRDSLLPKFMSGEIEV
ncbi:MAG: restriction endonuclease subunit S [Anaerolineaceae bacterium]|nr:restriction endonuclease subunit S [Anaerolineaceae bacterium]